MKRQKHTIEGMTKHVIKKIVDQEVYGWPPQCATIYFQPVRPSKEEKERLAKIENKDKQSIIAEM